MRYRPSAFSTVRFFKKPLGAGALVGFDFVTAWGGSASPVRTAALLFKRASHSFAGGVDRLEAVDRPAVQRHHPAVTRSRLRPCPIPVGNEMERGGWAPVRSVSGRMPTTVPPARAAPSLAAPETPPSPAVVITTPHSP